MLTALDLIGIFVFALSGAALAVPKQLDIVGAISLGLVTALAGGVLRDILLGSVPPAALTERSYLLVPLLASLLVVYTPKLLQLVRRPVLVFDAAGLGLFTVVGTDKALQSGLGVGGSVLIGVLSAVGGGIVRDVFVRDVPQIFTPKAGLYVIPATLGALAVALANRLNLDIATVSIVAASSVCALRLLSLRYGWSTPTLGGASDVESTGL